MNNKKHRSNTVFFVTKNPQFNIKPQVSTNTLCDFFKGLERDIYPVFRPGKWDKQGWIYLPCGFYVFGRKGGLIAMPRMNKKRKQEWALFLNERNRITYNELCRKCSNDCKQSFRCIVVLCPKWTHYVGVAKLLRGLQKINKGSQVHHNRLVLP